MHYNELLIKLKLLPHKDDDLDLMGEGFMGGGVHPPFTIFFDFRLRSLR